VALAIRSRLLQRASFSFQLISRTPLGLTQRGRGGYSFWIHTLSPPPDFELSVALTYSFVF